MSIEERGRRAVDAAWNSQAAAAARLRAQQVAEQAGKKREAKLIGGFFWWSLLGICIILDLLDLLFGGLELVLAATVIGGVISIAIYILDLLIDFFATTIVAGYYASCGAGAMRILIISSIQFLCEQVPILEVLPFLTVMFILTRVLENRKRKVLASTGIAGRVAGRLLGKFAPA